MFRWCYKSFVNYGNKGFYTIAYIGEFNALGRSYNTHINKIKKFTGSITNVNSNKILKKYK